MWKRGFPEEVAETLAEAEATLAGGLLERHGSREDLPGWVVVNLLAHADFDRLTTLAACAGAGTGRPRDAVAAFLASETLATAGSQAGLEALQRAYLVPLELRLLDAAAPLSLPAVATAVRARLARARARSRPPTSAPDE